MISKESFSNKLIIGPLLLFMTLGGLVHRSAAQERLPVREYTNPDEMITFDRTTEFQRALDVINDFSQENLGKIVIDRSNTTGEIGISIPAMHWRDALDMILNVKGLQLVERQDFFEILEPATVSSQAQAASGRPQQVGDQIANTKTREVRINAIFFEGNRRALREIGVDWSTLTESVPENVGDFGDGTDELPTPVGFTDQFVAVNSRGASNVSQNVFNSLVNFGEIGTSGIRVQALFSAFEADNLGEILASPSIKVMDGQEGNIQVGQDFSIKQRDFAGNVTDQFFSVGTILTVTPTIITQEDTTFIHLNVEAERSSAQPDPVSTIVNKQEATTQAILMDGEATAIAGLYRTEQAEVRRGIPLLKDLPPWFLGLRYLFGFNSEDYVMRELVILVQAEIEPSIPDRFGARQYASKFEVLNNERNRIRDEIDRQENYSPASLDEEIADDEETPMSADAEMADDEMMEEEDISPSADEEEQMEESSARVEPQTARDLPRQEIPQEMVVPELAVQPVPLNLGGEDGAQPAESDEVETSTQSSRDMANGGTVPSGYYVIGASFSIQENAVNFRERLAGEGFESHILQNPESDYYYVAYRKYESLMEAKNGLNDIQQYYNNPEAWIYTNE